MKNRTSGRLRFKLAQKISKKMILLYFGIYLFILVLLLIFLYPPLYRVADDHASDALNIVYDEFQNVQSTVTGYANMLDNEASLPFYLEEYASSPSDFTRAQIELILSDFVSNQESILAATLEDYSHNFFRSNYYHHVVNQERVAEDAHYQRLFEYTSASYFTLISPEIFYTTDRSVVSSHHTLVLTKIKYFRQKPYLLSIYYDMNNAFSHCGKLFENLFSDFAIFSPADGILYASGPAFESNPEMIQNLFDYHLSYDSKMTLKGKYYYRLNPSSNWIYIVFSPYPFLLYDMLVIAAILTALYLLSPLLYTFLLTPVINQLLAPLAKLYDAMKHYTAGGGQILNIKTGDEIEELCEIYNEMLGKIDQQIEDIKEKEHVNAITNYKLLATQIDPHFIYNTMNIINIMARQGKNEAIVEVNSALIKILRERLNSKLSISDTVEQEIDSLYQYHLIMNQRYDSQVHISVDVDEALLQCIIPKNILQPLAENCFYHGFANLKEGEEGLIEILIYSVEENLVIEINDNGMGIPEERLSILRNRSYQIYDDNKPHIGLDNIRQRLDYVYHENYQFQIHSTIGYGTTISITIPLTFEKPEP